jgi:hypothetical protein
MIIPLTSAATVQLPRPEHRVDGAVVYTITPGEAMTINGFADGYCGQIYILRVVTSGTDAFVVTLGSNFIKTGTLSTGTTSARYFSITFYSDGHSLIELARTAVAS